MGWFAVFPCIYPPAVGLSSDETMGEFRVISRSSQYDVPEKTGANLAVGTRLKH